ncbi:MAG: AI-2E family transporter [Deltaproteobacteria bacterium]|nr:AI-2E family transporter [Deltaproteobacteria bacterium]
MGPIKNSNIFFFFVLGAVTLLFLYLLRPFFFPIFWAVVIAGIFQPLYRRINRRLKHPNLSTIIIFLFIALLILLPLGTVGKLVFTEALQIYETLKPGTREIDTNFQRIIGAIADNPLADNLQIDKVFLSEKAAEIVRSIANYIFVNLKELTQNTLALLVMLAIMLYTLFFFIRDGDKFFQSAIRFFPLGLGRERLLYERFLLTVRSTLKVTLIIGGIQGIIGGILFFITGIEGAPIWGLLMILMAVVPVVGCSIIWAPAGILMLISGYIWEGALILGAGVLVISMIDNVLRPILIGKDVAMHPLLIFLSTLGGIFVFGFSGFVIGPIITSLLLAVWDMFDEFTKEL